VLFGSARVCQKPAEVDYRALQEATPEFKTIERERLQKGSARYEILMAKMTQRVGVAVKEIARQQGYDCVVVKGSVKNANGLTVVDATAAVLTKLQTHDEERGEH
jgi:Skp family chaperone for outer membrane proteins